MYKHLTLSQLKKILMVPSNYKVDACIVYGTYEDKKYKRKFLSLIKNKKYIKERLKHGFIEKILSVKIGQKRIWFIPEYGGARLSEFIHFGSMLGSKVNILIGSCGTLKKGLNEFAVIVPTFSYSTESSCHLYLRKKKDNRFYPDNKLSNEIINKLKDDFYVVSGPMMTCQAMMGETWGDILRWSKQGFYGVEMEASTIFSVSKHFKVPAAAMLGVADNLIEKEIVDSSSYENKRNKLRKIRNVLLKTAIEISLKK